jgi:DNA (cytosine-5)-methyltransferase 1
MQRSGRYSPSNLIRSENLPSVKGEAIVLPQKLDDPTEEEKWLQQLADSRVPKIIDLFCGAGGMSEGFVNAGFAVAAAFDHDLQACSTFGANIPAKVLCKDISEIKEPAAMLEGLELSGIDAIIGGPPCQGFSVVGRARIRSLEESEQVRLLARNELYQHFFRFVEAFQPSIFVMENVPALENFEAGAYLEAIRRESDRLGYVLESETIDAVDHGVPQTRRRLIIVGSRIGRLFRWPRTIHEQDKVSLINAIGDLPAVMPPSLKECLPYPGNLTLTPYQQLMRSRVRPDDKKVIYDHIVRPVRQDDIEIFTHMKPGDRYIDIDPQYRRYNSASFEDKYYMLKPDAPGVTITAHLAKDGYRYIHWDTAQHRTISVREAARIQSFGDHFRFAGSRSSRFRQIGNAVPPLMAEKIAEQVRRALKRATGGLPGDALQLALPGLERWTQLVVDSE